MSEAVTELRIALTVDDFEEAVAFYRDALGMKVLEMWNAPGANGVLLEAGHATLELFDEGQAAAVDGIEVGRRVAGRVRFALEVEDSAATAGRLEAGGADRLGGPVVTPWGDTNVRLQAPDGMQLTLFSRRRLDGGDPGAPVRGE
jgi:methylmalonyl-CoA/ethylmalonyl-CoA epimerase